MRKKFKDRRRVLRYTYFDIFFMITLGTYILDYFQLLNPLNTEIIIVQVFEVFTLFFLPYFHSSFY